MPKERQRFRCIWEFCQPNTFDIAEYSYFVLCTIAPAKRPLCPPFVTFIVSLTKCFKYKQLGDRDGQSAQARSFDGKQNLAERKRRWSVRLMRSRTTSGWTIQYLWNKVRRWIFLLKDTASTSPPVRPPHPTIRLRHSLPHFASQGSWKSFLRASKKAWCIRIHNKIY